jgi:hypothetical protein
MSSRIIETFFFFPTSCRFYGVLAQLYRAVVCTGVFWLERKCVVNSRAAVAFQSLRVVFVCSLSTNFYFGSAIAEVVYEPRGYSNRHHNAGQDFS